MLLTKNNISYILKHMNKLLIQQIIEIAGGQTALSVVCGGNVTQSHVHNWLHRDEKIPPKYTLSIEQMCADQGHSHIDRYVMWPCIFGPRPKEAVLSI